MAEVPLSVFMEGFIMPGYDEKIHEECGVFGIWEQPGTDVAKSIYFGLVSLQHRGQESAGIAVTDTTGERGNMGYHKGMGLVSEVFKAGMLDTMKGNIGVGHVRYSTTGGSKIENAQPVAFNYLKGTLAMVHNGNIANTAALRKQMLEEGDVFRSDTDSEVVACLIAKERSKAPNIQSAAKNAAKKLIGSYSIIIMSPRKLVAMRDPLGLRPMCLGKRDNAWVVASETCALKAIDAEYVRDVEPGEIITISRHGIESDRELCGQTHAHCIFEYIYFARLDSVIDGESVYDARFNSGRLLAKAYPVDADIAVGVPESGITGAAGYAAEAGIPFALAFQKNSYMGRTFIKPTQSERESAVHMKLNVIDSVVKGKKVVLIDDSIVRGTTMKNLIKMLRKAGATEIHVRVSSPPFLHPCYYGTDVPDNAQLIANLMTQDEIREMIGADSLGYMKVEDLDKMVPGLSFCKACFNGEYPTPV